MLNTYNKLNILTELCEIIESDKNCDLKKLILIVVKSDLDEEDKNDIFSVLNHYLLNRNDKPLKNYFESILEYELMNMIENQMDEQRYEELGGE